MLFLAGTREGEAMRDRIEKVAKANPGITKSALARKIGVHFNAIRHHVAILHKQGRIEVDERGHRHELFSPDVPFAHRRLVAALRHPDKSIVLDAVLAEPGIGSFQLERELGMTRKRVLTQLAHLQEEGLVRKVGMARPRYKPVDLPADLDQLRRSLGHDEAIATDPAMGRTGDEGRHHLT